MDLRLPLILLCVSTSLSIEDNETEGLPISVLNVSSEDYALKKYLDGLRRPGAGPIDNTGFMPMVPRDKWLFDDEWFFDDTIGFIPQSPADDLNSTVISGNETTMNSTQQIEVHILHKTFLHEFKEHMNSWLVTKFVPSIYTVVLLVSLPLNIMAIIVFLVKVKVKKPAVVFLLNLAAADVLFVCILPFHIVYRFSGNNWMVGEGMCRLVTAMYLSNMRGSILLMTSISVDRFLALVYPVQSLSWRTVRRAWLVCCCIWVISMVSTVPILIRQQTRPFPDLNITTCTDILDAESVERFHVYYYFPFYIALFYFLPLIITTVCYIGIVRSLRAPSMKGAQKRSRAVLLTAVVLCVFVLCFGPANVIWFMHYLQVYNQGNNLLYTVYIISVSMSSVSCCLDPLIYYYASSEWQRHVYSLLGCKREQTPPVGHQRVLLHKDQTQKTPNKPSETSRVL
ncbi:proteinase-activated receptor 1-like isoform X2 [Rana temporaria]|uniref:proteinase-activated receptor 1-like isoform X2 n=1 Tax=Rana temporaria TaxID=8407 RepID=UPI001AAC5790|nr:proteinase-activated receptor 1-like isoform X2 [Rana temporaria]